MQRQDSTDSINSMDFDFDDTEPDEFHLHGHNETHLRGDSASSGEDGGAHVVSPGGPMLIKPMGSAKKSKLSFTRQSSLSKETNTVGESKMIYNAEKQM